MAKPRKPKLLKSPRKPKSKTVQSMENFLRRKREVASMNSKKESDYKRDVKKWESLKNQVARA